MEKSKRPKSIRIIYWLTQIAFWLFTVVGGVAAIACLIALIGFAPEGLNLHMDAPFIFDLEDSGILESGDQASSITLTNLHGKIGFANTPLYIVRPVAITVLIIIALAFNVIRMFLAFIKQVYAGHYFDRQNVKYLKRMALWLSGIWLFTKVYFAVFYFWIGSKISFEGIRITKMFDSGNHLLLVALFIWVLSHIFMKGMELAEEQKLTV